MIVKKSPAEASRNRLFVIYWVKVTHKMFKFLKNWELTSRLGGLPGRKKVKRWEVTKHEEP